MTTFVLNGDKVSVGDHPHLLSALREELGVTSPKDGCAPSGQCGCCTVLLDGKPVVACQVSLARADGKEVTTLEGLDAAERERFATEFATRGALQCGFCIPGIVLRAKSLIDRRGAALTRDDAARHLGAHLCRCTGYLKILDAVEALAHASMAPAPDQAPASASASAPAGGGIGSRQTRYQGIELTLGDKPYIDDIRLPGMLHAALRLSDHARATVTAIDARAALEQPGVIAVLTAADIPGELRVGILHKDWPVMIPVGGRTSYLGDVLAVVVAQDRATSGTPTPRPNGARCRTWWTPWPGTRRSRPSSSRRGPNDDVRAQR
ncbi:MAG TPA: 2Fe-2S iron-sulfur cluster-binding protein [Acidimicrobiales bacterium]